LQGNKRSMRKDFGGDAARDNVWMQDKSKQGPPGAVDRSQLYSVPFAEYYKAQVTSQQHSAAAHLFDQHGSFDPKCIATE
jgi:hypothetical protein